jgi:hypothetical protein
MLLLGYSVEMFLKAGLAKAYIGCRAGMFDRDIRRFSHDLKQISHRIHFPFQGGDDRSLLELRRLIVNGALYPITPNRTIEYTAAWNQRTSLVWSRNIFSGLCDLAKRVRNHVEGIDQDESNPLSHGSWDIDADGHMAFRVGGNLPPQIIYSPSTLMKATGKDKPADLRRIFPEADYPGLHYYLDRYWDRFTIYLDGAKSTETLVDPRAASTRRDCVG